MIHSQHRLKKGARLLDSSSREDHGATLQKNKTRTQTTAAPRRKGFTTTFPHPIDRAHSSKPLTKGSPLTFRNGKKQGLNHQARRSLFLQLFYLSKNMTSSKSRKKEKWEEMANRGAGWMQSVPGQHELQKQARSNAAVAEVSTLPQTGTTQEGREQEPPKTDVSV